jgi:hypothetical protein
MEFVLFWVLDPECPLEVESKHQEVRGNHTDPIRPTTKRGLVLNQTVEITQQNKILEGATQIDVQKIKVVKVVTWA